MARSFGRLFLEDRMKIVGICGSPRKGNTEFLLKEALKAAEEKGAETELILLREKKIEFCDGCLECDKTGKCHIQDDMQKIYEKLTSADAIIIGSPNYFENVSGILKNFIDRSVIFYTNKKLTDKPIAAIGVGGGSGKEPIDIIKNFSSAVYAKFIGSISAVAGEEGDVLKDKKALMEARKLGEKMVE